MSTIKEVLDLVIFELRRLGNTKGAVLYSILFREAGVALQWWERDRAGEEPKPNLNIKFMPQRLAEYNSRMRQWNERGLVVYHYYPTLSDAIEAEEKRLKEMK